MKATVPDIGTQLKTVNKAVDVLRAFDARDEWGVRELARELGLPSSVVHRLVATLAAGGLLERVEDRGTYVLGVQLVALARRATQRSTVVSLGHRHVVRLAQTIGGTAFLTVLQGHRHICLDIVDYSANVNSVVQVGDTIGLHAGAAGKVILAFQSDEFVDDVLAEPLIRYTDQTILDPQRIRAELLDIRRRGWAYSAGETTPGTAAVAAPIFDQDGAVVASINGTLTDQDMQVGRINHITEITRRLASAISHEVGHRSAGASASQLA